MVLILVPQIKYPANPPSVGNPDTWNATLVGGTAYHTATEKFLVERLGQALPSVLTVEGPELSGGDHQ